MQNVCVTDYHGCVPFVTVPISSILSLLWMFTCMTGATCGGRNYLPWWCTLVTCNLGLLPLTSLYFSSRFCSMLWCPLRFSHQTMFSFSLLPLDLQGVHRVLYVSIYSYSCSTPISYQITLKSNIVLCVWSCWSGRESVQFCSCFCLYWYCRSIIKRLGLESIEWFNPATYLYLSQVVPLISIGVCCVLYCDLRWELAGVKPLFLVNDAIMQVFSPHVSILNLCLAITWHLSLNTEIKYVLLEVHLLIKII